MKHTEKADILPRPAVGAVVKYEDCFLLVKRANPPSQNMWAIPGGKIRLGETLQQAAQREVLEETGIVVRAGNPVLTFDLIEHDKLGNIIFHYVVVDVFAEYISGNILAGGDAREAIWAHRNELHEFNLNQITLDLFSDLIQCN